MSDINPLQKQDNVQRNQSASEVRSSEESKAATDGKHNADALKKDAESKDSELQEANETEGQLNKDGGDGKKKGKAFLKNKSQQEEKPEEQRKSPRSPPKYMGGQFFDGTA